jgi:Methyltransferase domain
MSVLLDFLRKSAFTELTITEYVPDTHGWMDSGFSRIITESLASRDRTLPLTIFEVGSWKGKSCITIANTVKNMGFTDVRIIAVDTWLGAPEFWTWGLSDPTRGLSLKLMNGYPSVFYTFTKNVKYFGHDDIVYPFPISSIQAAEVLTHYDIKADLIYIDASHEYEPVKADIAAFWPLLNDGGIMIGDDYVPNWPGVVRAVNEFGKANIDGIVWKFMKVNHIQPKTQIIKFTNGRFTL